MRTIVYDALPKEARKIREMVFMQEQGFQEEFDTIDDYAKHLILFDGEVAAGTCRFFLDRERKQYVIGRIAVLRQYRGQHLGAKLLEQAEAQIKRAGGETVILHAQKQAEPFYEKQGYAEYGAPDFEEGCPHVWMFKKLN